MALRMETKRAVRLSLTRPVALLAEELGCDEAKLRRRLATRSARAYREALLAEMELLTETAATVCRAAAACALGTALIEADTKALIEVAKLATLLERTQAAGPDPLEAILDRLTAQEETS